MTAHARLASYGHDNVASGSTHRVVETHGGYRITRVRGQLDIDLLAEASLKFFAFVLILSSGLLWVLPGSLFTGEVLLMKIALTASCALTGLGLYWHAHKGFSDEVQVDTTHREMRLASRNTRGDAKVRRRIHMRDVESCFVRRSKGSNQAQLCLRIRGEMQPLPLLTGGEIEVSRFCERIAGDLRAIRERLASRAA